jgi:methionyl-tRNA formyltransferase
MRSVFMGTAQFAVPSLKAVVSAGHDIAGVFTQPDRPAGRGQKLHASAVKNAALALGLDIHQPDSLKLDPVIRLFDQLKPDLLIVVAYGKIIPQWLRELSLNGAINVHGSLLPRYRGAAPVNWAIAGGESLTGVCTMAIDAGLDTGPVYDCESTAIGENETAPELSERLSRLGAPLLVRTIEAIARGDAEFRQQDDSLATRAPRLQKEDGRIRWSESARTIHNEVRAFVPWPSVVVSFRGGACRILETRETEDRVESSVSGMIVFENRRLGVCCGDGRVLEVLRLQMENRKAVSGTDFAHGMRLRAGERFVAFGEDATDPDRTLPAID